MIPFMSQVPMTLTVARRLPPHHISTAKQNKEVTRLVPQGQWIQISYKRLFFPWLITRAIHIGTHDVASLYPQHYKITPPQGSHIANTFRGSPTSQIL